MTKDRVWLVYYKDDTASRMFIEARTREEAISIGSRDLELPKSYLRATTRDNQLLYD